MSRTDIWKFVAPLLFWLMLDRLAIALIDEHLLSARVFAAIPVMPGIIAEASAGFWKLLAVEIAVWFLICNAIAWGAKAWSRNQIGGTRLRLLTIAAWIAVLVPCVDGFFAVTDASNESRLFEVNQTPITERHSRRIRRIGFAQVDEVRSDSPDILIVVLESFRHELVSDEVMPNLASAAKQGLWCKHHFSSGNATSHGLFSIVTGMDATWFDTSLRYTPPLYRLFRSAGYEIGFFAGHDDWRKFYMDGFVTPGHFDEFAITPQNRLASDRQAIQAAINFLEPISLRPPRLAILYLYITHAPYRSYAKDRTFRPAAKDGFLIPYSTDVVDEVWNRYKNSARTADRWIGSLLSDSENRIVVVTGDHGESFLEDGTIGHGSKISPQQNRTPLVLVGPGLPRREMNEPTIHSDVLPTLLAATGINLIDSGATKDSLEPLFDGFNLLDVRKDALSSRQNVTRDYLTNDVRLIKDF